MRAIVFGANGQDGHYLTELLKRNNCEVIGISRKGDFIHADVADLNVTSDLIARYRPEYIFHFAANSTTRHEVLFENHATIATGTLNILEAVKTYSPHTKVFLTGSGLQFENHGGPIKETDSFEARDAYSISRIQSVYAARYFRSLGFKIYVGYLFNHDSPLRTERHMTKKISETAKRIALGSKEKLEIGDISVVKEYSYAGDIVKGIWTFMNQDNIFEANISSGKGYSIQDWLQQCFSLINEKWEDHVVIKKDYVAEYRQLLSDPSLIFSLGWKPQTSFEDLAKMMMSR